MLLTFRHTGVLPVLRAAPVNENVFSEKRFLAVPLKEDGSITVKLAPMEVLKVEITDINTSDHLNVNIHEVGGYSIWGKIPVEIKE